LALDGWNREETTTGASPSTKLCITTIRNCGPGVALNVFIDSERIEDDHRAAAISSTRTIGVVAAGASVLINHEIIVFWNHVPLRSGKNKTTSLKIELACRDTLGQTLHQITYNMAISQSLKVVSADSVAPGVVAYRYPQTESILARKIKSWLGLKLK